ncbi:type I-U CRISPR-associated protein Cas7 [Dokdonella sp.]|uniref:type I-G CRISPR-associated protein Cas7 n=1 Tax=Dokdonella sp. TaxID=2291710 RepID=UPI0031C9290B|nr:type I-U CRISPR-associated protein Cas7 [Dokdonella sp.]
MSDAEKKSPPKKLTPADVLKGESPLVLTATLEPIVGDRFQPAGFPEIGHVIYKAPRKDGSTENVCIVDSAASMANHLEAVCQRGAHDLDLVDELSGMPYIRCVTGDLVDDKLPSDKRETIVTSLTEGHRIASTYFFGARNKKSLKWDGKGGQRVDPDGTVSTVSFGDELATGGKFGIALDGEKVAHPPPEKWWNVFKTIFEIDPNSLVHGVMFPQWQIKIPRALTAHLEAFGAGRVDRSGVKFDRLGKTTSRQPIFAVDDVTAESIRATFVLDVSLIRSFGRLKGGSTLGLSEKQQEFLVALALWKIQKLLASPFRFRSGCHLRCATLKRYEQEVEFDVDIGTAINAAAFGARPVTDVFWPREELYREGQAEAAKSADEDEALEETEE